MLGYIGIMARYFLIETGNFFKRFDFYALMGTLLAILGIVLPLIPSNNLYAFFSFSDERQLLLYISRILLIFLIVVISFQILGNVMIYWGRNIKVNAEIIEYLQTHSNPQYFSIKILNHERKDLTDCKATLILAEQFYNPTSVLDILEDINPNSSLMSWGGGSHSEYVTVPGESGQKVLNIAYHESAGHIIFPFYEWTSKPQLANVKYHVIIKINGRLDGEPFRAIKYEGYFLSKNYIAPLVPISSGRIGKDGEFTQERKTVHGGTPETWLGFVKRDDKSEDI
jgi:hypothetical protein